MNIFLPYENSVKKSVEALDDLRLRKQLVECYQLLTLAIKEQQEGHEIKAGHYHHPVYLFYKDNIPFLTYYGYECCREYCYRFGKWHSLTLFFDRQMSDLGMFEFDSDGYIIANEIPKFTPFYMEGSKSQPNYIRTTKNVSALFQNKLCKKWDVDKLKGRSPKWTKRNVPNFYQIYLKERNNGRKREI